MNKVYRYLQAAVMSVFVFSTAFSMTSNLKSFDPSDPLSLVDAAVATDNCAGHMSDCGMRTGCPAEYPDCGQFMMECDCSKKRPTPKPSASAPSDDSGCSGEYELMGGGCGDIEPDEPTVTSPIDEPVTVNPITENPATEIPVTENPATEIPVTENPVTETGGETLTSTEESTTSSLDFSSYLLRYFGW